MNKKFLSLFVIYTMIFSSCNTAMNTDTTSESQSTLATTTQSVSQNTSQPDIIFTTFDVNKKYYNNDSSGFVELDLKLPRLQGDYDGIAEINSFFVGKEEFFYNQLPIDFFELNEKVEGKKDNFYRSAYYNFEVQLGNIISVSGFLDGGAGGVGWGGIEGDTFDLNTGKKLTLSDIFNVGEDKYLKFIYDFVSEKIMDDIKAGKDLYLFEDAYSGDGYEEIRKFNPDNFFLTKTSLVVFYEKYALAIGAAGPQKYEIPYESILNILAIDIGK